MDSSNLDSLLDGSWLLGPLVIIPALLYLSFWHSVNGEFLRHAERVDATVVELERRVKRGRHGEEYFSWFTHVEFADLDGNIRVGTLDGALEDCEVGASVPIYYHRTEPDFRFAGADGIHGGLYNALTAIAIGVGLGLIGWFGFHQRRPQQQ